MMLNDPESGEGAEAFLKTHPGRRGNAAFSHHIGLGKIDAPTLPFLLGTTPRSPELQRV